MSNQESVENYLKALLILRQKRGVVRQIDLAQQMGFAKPSVSKAVHLMEQKQLVVLEEDRNISLTPAGELRAREVLAKHEYFTQLLIRCGVDGETAAREACGMEHVISDESFERIRQALPLEPEGAVS